MIDDNEQRRQRWRLVLGHDAMESSSQELSEEQMGMDEALQSVYGGGGEDGGMGDADLDVARWVNDVRSYFPTPVVKMMQSDALENVNMRKLLREPETLAAIEPDVHLVGRLLSLNRVLPARTRDTARQVVQRVVDELMQKLSLQMREALSGRLNRPVPTRRPRYKEINWHRTIRRNLKHYQPRYETIIPERLVGYGKQQTALQDIILVVDQSGSMSASVVYASIFAAVLASLPSVQTRLIAFSTSVVDLTDHLEDPVSLLFGAQLRGGTDIERALTFAQQHIKRPEDTILVLISDLFDGKGAKLVVDRMQSIVASGVRTVVLLALNDDGSPRYNAELAGELGELGIPSFACTPDMFPELMGAALNGEDLQQWAKQQPRALL